MIVASLLACSPGQVTLTVAHVPDEPETTTLPLVGSTLHTAGMSVGLTLGTATRCDQPAADTWSTEHPTPVDLLGQPSTPITLEAPPGAVCRVSLAFGSQAGGDVIWATGVTSGGNAFEVHLASAGQVSLHRDDGLPVASVGPDEVPVLVGIDTTRWVRTLAIDGLLPDGDGVLRLDGVEPEGQPPDVEADILSELWLRVEASVALYEDADGDGLAD